LRVSHDGINKLPRYGFKQFEISNARRRIKARIGFNHGRKEVSHAASRFVGGPAVFPRENEIRVSPLKP
jgi:hypothetical protein